MKIAIVGTGRIGGGLARAWSAAGHDVMLGVRDPSAAKARILAEDVGVAAMEIPEAAKEADVVVLAIPHAAVDEVVFSIGPLRGQIVVDCTNAVGPGMVPEFDHTTSAAEELQSQIPNARVFKSFNAQGAEIIGNAMFGTTRASNFFCGDDPDARAAVNALIVDAGFDPVYVGGLDKARLLESLMLLWVAAAKEGKSRSIAFKLLQR